jgi:hypothetical protein
VEDNLKLQASLAYWLAAGKLRPNTVLPAMQALATTGESPDSLLTLLETFAGSQDERLLVLADQLRQTLRAEALQFYSKRKQSAAVSQDSLAALGGLPLELGKEWTGSASLSDAIGAAVRACVELDFLAQKQEKAPRLYRELQTIAARTLALAANAIVEKFQRPPPCCLDELEQAWPADMPGRDAALRHLRQCVSQTREDHPDISRETSFTALSPTEKAGFLDSLCAWATPAQAEAIREAAIEPWARERAMLILTMRFGQPALLTWKGWEQWLSGQAGSWRLETDELVQTIRNRSRELLLVLYSQSPDLNPSVLGQIIAAVKEFSPPVEIGSFLRRWGGWMSETERMELAGLSPTPVPPVLPAATAPPIIAAPPVPIPSPPREPPKPGVWERHLQPFFAENWYMVAGIAMVILGSSLLAYYTWDKHWLLRYTIMPTLLAVFTWSLAGVGTWIEKKADEFKTTAAILRGAAIGLLPINFMAIALLSGDEKVTQKVPALIIMAAIYLTLFGFGLRRWCNAVHPVIGNLLGVTLLALNALVMVGPVARTIGGMEGQGLLLCVGAGFYAGFFIMAAAIVRFARKILTRQLAEEKRVPWFFASALAVTFLQVFVWVHGFMRHLPQAPTYALLVIACGWLVLYSERRALELRLTPQLHGGESFLGFAMILLGILMGFTEPGVRIASFVVAGGIWLYQAFSRQHPLHYWIALTLWTLGVASVGLLPQYPGPCLPLLGIVLALGMGLGILLSQRYQQDELSQACRGMQVVVLFLTIIVAPLVQWRFHSVPWATAIWLTLAAALFAWRALKDQNLHWLHTTMIVLALVLPYAGFMDVADRNAHHNTMVFGLALVSYLWLAATRLCSKQHPLLLQARSTVLWFYGILAVAAMLLRVFMGDMGAQPLWYRDYMDYGGPILMMIALVPATYYSRSLIPAGMAVAIMAVLFPELKADLQLTTPWLGWGTGLGSAIGGLLLTWLCFLLRPWTFLKDLPEGDLFMGRDVFPLRRLDHTLFTWPIVAAATFLIVKVETWTLVQNQLAGGVPLKTAVALGLTGVAWTFLAIYHRTRQGAVAAVHLGWICVLAGISFGYWRKASAPHWSWPFLVTGLLLQGLYWYYRFSLQNIFAWATDLLTEPARQALTLGSGALAMACMIHLVEGGAFDRVQFLFWFVAAQLIWHALRERHWIFGAMLFFQLWIGLLAVTAPGSAELWNRVSAANSATPTLWLLVAIQLISAALEALPAVHRRLEIVFTPAFVIASALAVLTGIPGLVDGIMFFELSQEQQLLLLTLVLLTARAQVSALVLLLGDLLGYLLILRAALRACTSLEQEIRLLATPWRLAVLALVMVLLTIFGRWLRQKRPELLAGKFAKPFFAAPSPDWVLVPAVLIAVIAPLYHTFDPVLRESAAQLWAPYLGVITLALVAWFRNWLQLYLAAGILLLLGDVHLVRVFAGAYLREHGLSELNLVCFGLSLGLLQAAFFRLIWRAGDAVRAINLASLAVAGLTLALLTANYFTEPDLAAMTNTRFVTSGLLAWLAGWYFRRAARHPAPGEEAHVDLCEALYHYGVVLAFWCAFLMIPWFRKPLFTLIALGLPVAYFYLRAELGARSGATESLRYRNSAAVLCFVVLGLYACKSIFQMIVFPGTAVGTQYYHYNAPLIMLLGLVMLRLRGLGGTGWLAFYGGLAVMAGSYFLTTALPGFSPFDYPMPGAWCAIVLGHFWIVVSHTRSPLRSGIQQLARLEDEAWLSLRHYWGLSLLVVTQGAVAWGIADYAANTRMVAPLLAGAATVLIHQGAIRRSMVSLILAAVELVVALHMDFLIPSYLPKEYVIWAFVIIWLGVLITHEFLREKIPAAIIGWIVAPLAALVFAHVLYHRPWSVIGLWGVGLGAILAAWHPVRYPRTASFNERLFAAVLPWLPVWLIYFSQSRFEEAGPPAAWERWPVLTALAAIFLTGLYVRFIAIHGAKAFQARPRSHLRLFDVSLVWFETSGRVVFYSTLWLTLIPALVVQAFYYRTAFSPREIVLLILLEAGLAVAWYFEGKERPTLVAYYMMQLCAVACFAAVRRHLMLTTTFWNYEYDVWASLVCSLVLAGAKQVFDNQPRAVRVPMLTSMLTLPAIALVWVLVHGMGVNMALLVVGLHSVLFAYLGKDSRESPYNILALSGFVAFILMTFYSKLHLMAVHAYVIPVGLGILVLQEIFRGRIQAETRNWIRLVTLMAMLGSAGYYALADPRHPITFNLTMIILCLLTMGLGSFLKIRLYLAMGFAGLAVDLVSMVYKSLVFMDRNVRMTVIGASVLVLGAAFVFGAIYYKTRKAAVDDLVSRLRLKLSQWQ